MNDDRFANSLRSEIIAGRKIFVVKIIDRLEQRTQKRKTCRKRELVLVKVTIERAERIIIEDQIRTEAVPTGADQSDGNSSKGVGGFSEQTHWTIDE